MRIRRGDGTHHAAANDGMRGGPAQDLMLGPHDFAKSAIFDPLTRTLMDKIEFKHGAKP